MLEWVIERIYRTKNSNRVIIATSDRDIDDPIARFGEARKIDIFRGPSEDVAGRALACADKFGCERFVRISGDSPFIDSTLIDALLEKHRAERLDIATNIYPRSFPAGASVEVITTAAMRRAVAETNNPGDREHVTPYFYRHPTKFRIGNLAAKDRRYGQVHLAVDTDEDFRRCVDIARCLGADGLDAGLAQIVDLALAHDTANQMTERQAVSAKH